MRPDRPDMRHPQLRRSIRVLYVSSEARPLAQSGGLAEVSGSLPAALRGLGLDVRVLLPGYPAVLAASGLRTAARNIDLLPGRQPGRLLRGCFADNDVPLFVLDAPDLFLRDGGLYSDENGVDWPDNPWRFASLSKAAAVLATTSSPLSWRPDLVHCNDWQTGLCPAYLAYSQEPAAPSLMAVHNLAFSGNAATEPLPTLGLPWDSYQMEGLEFYGSISYPKAGLHYAQRLVTVSPTYAREIRTAAFGCGLDGLLERRRNDLSGIINGIDTAVWNPLTDTALERKYSVRSLHRKNVNKLALQRELGLIVDPSTPLCGVVSRLTSQKGLDMLVPLAEAVGTASIQLVILGNGDAQLERDLSHLARRFPKRVSTTIGFNERMAHRIEAGADMFLMPSRFEPCGLSQLYSMRYGTPPVVRRTGGLADSVVDTTAESLAAGQATGFVFSRDEPGEFIACVERALAYYAQPQRWRQIQHAGMVKDLSWQASALQYATLYREMLS